MVVSLSRLPRCNKEACCEHPSKTTCVEISMFYQRRTSKGLVNASLVVSHVAQHTQKVIDQ